MSYLMSVELRSAKDLFNIFGGANGLAKLLDIRKETVLAWSASVKGVVPQRYRTKIHNLALERNVKLPDDFINKGINNERNGLARWNNKRVFRRTGIALILLYNLSRIAHGMLLKP